MIVYEGKLKGVLLIESTVFEDNRGFFMESYNREEFRKHGITMDWIQDNHSLSAQPGVIRGLHYQLEPKAQTKLVRVTVGAIYDVVVDIRVGTPTFGQWESYELTASNKQQLLVPRGFAHGFCTLMPNTEVQYKVDERFSKEHDRGIAWDDPTLGIPWPVTDPYLSNKDSCHPILTEAEINYVY
jgi:dTDP-4-dehydrorhamnose 3,5-epimerase